MQNYTTQMDAARKGIVTPEMEIVAKKEYRTTEEIRQQIGADSLGYMPIDELQNMVGDLPICRACFDSHYPMEVPKQDISALLES